VGSDHVAQSLINSGLKNFQGWEMYIFFGHTDPLLDCPHSGQVFPYVQSLLQILSYSNFGHCLLFSHHAPHILYGTKLDAILYIWSTSVAQRGIIPSFNILAFPQLMQPMSLGALSAVHGLLAHQQPLRLHIAARNCSFPGITHLSPIC